MAYNLVMLSARVLINIKKDRNEWITWATDFSPGGYFGLGMKQKLGIILN